jgi:hypothetical protein
MGVAALAAMKHVWSKTPAEGMVAGVQRVLSGLRQGDAAEPTLDLEHLVQYYAAAAPHLTQQDLDLLPEHLQEASKMTLAEKWMRQGRREGRKQGLEEGREVGRQEGQRRLLAKQLRLKFGELHASALVWLEAADQPALEAASERVLTAATLAETLGLT